MSPIVRLYPKTLPSCFLGVKSATQACVCPQNPLANPKNTINNVNDDTELDSEINSETMPVKKRLMAIGLFRPKESVVCRQEGCNRDLRLQQYQLQVPNLMGLNLEVHRQKLE